MPRKRAKKSAESKKIAMLMHEGKPQDQAVATALNMKREGRLTEAGGYRRAGRKRRKGGRY